MVGLVFFRRKKSKSRTKRTLASFQIEYGSGVLLADEVVAAAHILVGGESV